MICWYCTQVFGGLADEAKCKIDGRVIPNLLSKEPCICPLDAHIQKFSIGDLLKDEDGNSGIVVIKWNDGDICELENDAAHPNPKIVGHSHWSMSRKKRRKDA